MKSTRWALCAAFTEETLDELVSLAVGDGVTLDQVETDVALPGMGDVRLRVTLTVNGGRFHLSAEDGGRVRVVVSAAGDVAAEALGFEGSTAPVAPMLPSAPVPIPILVEALVDPVVDLHDDLTMTVGLAVDGGELVGVTVDADAPVPDGIDPDAWMPMTQMMNLLFASMGEQLWTSLGEHVGVVGSDLGADLGEVFADLGVATGRAEASVATGLLTIGMPAGPDVVGRATPEPVGGKRLAVSLARSGVDKVAELLLTSVAGDRPLPFEIQVDLGDQQVRSTLRQTRVLSERVPDLRLALRSDLRLRLTGGRLEVSVRSVWVEWPEVLPTFGVTGAINEMNRRLGGLLSFAPLRMRFPSVIQVPLGEDPEGATQTVGLRIDDLRVNADGVGVVAGLA